MHTRGIVRWAVSVYLATAALLATGLIVSPLPASGSKPASIIDCNLSIQACIDGASSGDTIVVAAGTYNESLTLSKPVSLTGASSASTIVLAISGQRVLTITGSAISNTVIISGLTFADGNVSSGSALPDNYGGGILVQNSAQPILQNIVISNNRAYGGGGLYAEAALTLTNVNLISNTASSGGGAYISGIATLIGGRFERNTAMSAGGGLFGVSLFLSGTQFLTNTSGDFGGGVYVDTPAILNTGIFMGNRATSGGGAIVANYVTITGTQFISNTGGPLGGGALLSGIGVVRVTGARFERNVANSGSGGGIGRDIDLIVSNTQFVSNTAVGGGGAYVNDLTSLSSLFQGNNASNGGGAFVRFKLAITASQFISNRASTNGGGLYHFDLFGSGGRIANAQFARNTAGRAGAGMYLNSEGDVLVLHTTIADTSLNPGQAIVAAKGTTYITNTIIAMHSVAISETGQPLLSTSVYEDYNLFFGNTLTRTGIVTSGGNSLSGNPLFFGASADNYHILPGSAAINAGSNAGVTTDFDGNARPLDGGFDIGYDEYVPGSIRLLFLPLVLKNH